MHTRRPPSEVLSLALTIVLTAEHAASLWAVTCNAEFAKPLVGRARWQFLRVSPTPRARARGATAPDRVRARLLAVVVVGGWRRRAGGSDAPGPARPLVVCLPPQARDAALRPHRDRVLLGGALARRGS